ncbi:MAG TPA: hypothetical protein VKC59_08005 [Candidatus Limnocylindrales bacterium]|nr:hypothetical protein [Candidatus Limnocylindrales bacterium]
MGWFERRAARRPGRIEIGGLRESAGQLERGHAMGEGPRGARPIDVAAAVAVVRAAALSTTVSRQAASVGQ